MATQNPIETEGTYPLPEAQVDRFMMKVLVGYPTEEEEFVIVERVTGADSEVAAVATTDELARAAEGVPARLRRSGADPVRGQARRGDPRPGPLRPGGARAVPHLRREPARVDPPDRRRARARLPARPQLRAARGRRATSRTTCCATGWCSPTRRWPKGRPPTTLIDRVLQQIPAPPKPLETHVRFHPAG